MIIVKNVYLYNDISLVNQSSLGFFSGGSFFYALAVFRLRYARYLLK